MKGTALLLVCLLSTGCASWTPAQKRAAAHVGAVIIVGSAAAMLAAHNGGSPPAAPRQYPCGCSPQPAVK